MSVTEEWEAYTHLICAFIATGYLANDHPQSLLLVGDPGEGKSELLARFSEVPTTVYLSDVTSDGLRRKVLPDMRDSRKKHILFPELYKLYQRQAHTVENTTGVLTLAMTGEMHTAIIGNEAMPKLPDGFRIGIIGAMPTFIFNQWQRGMNATGLIDRMMTVPVEFSSALKSHIRDNIIRGDRRMLSKVKLRHLTHPVSVTMPTSVHGQVNKILDALSSRHESNRAAAAIRALVKAAAALRGSTNVEPQDVRMIARLAEYIR